MGISNQIQLAGTVAGVGITGTMSKTTDGTIAQNVEVPAAAAGTLSTRTSNSQGTATLASGHGVETGDVVDVYWSGGVRYGVTVGTVSGTSVPLTDSGAGDNYPAEDTVIYVSPVFTVTLDLDGDDLEIMAIGSNRRCHLDFRDSGGSELAIELAAGEAWQWITGKGFANPIAGDTIETVLVSNGDSANAATVKIGIGYDSATS